jgi:hypothetical protein
MMVSQSVTRQHERAIGNGGGNIGMGDQQNAGARFADLGGEQL